MVSFQGATIRKDEETGEIFIARVIHGGLADRSGEMKLCECVWLWPAKRDCGPLLPGLLHPGDLIVEVNGSPVVGLDPEEVIHILVGLPNHSLNKPTRTVD